MKLKVINTTNKRADYIGGFTPIEEQMIRHFIKGYTINLFCGKCQIGDERIDIKREFINKHTGEIENTSANIIMNVFDYIQNIKYPKQKPKSLIVDPAYNETYKKKYESKFVIFANVKMTNQLFKWIIKQQFERIVIKSWNFYRFKHYSINEKYSRILYYGGYRKSTFLLCQNRKNKDITEWR